MDVGAAGSSRSRAGREQTVHGGAEFGGEPAMVHLDVRSASRGLDDAEVAGVRQITEQWQEVGRTQHPVRRRRPRGLRSRPGTLATPHPSWVL